MKAKRLPTDLTVEELLNALEQPAPTSEEKNGNLIQMPDYNGQFLDTNPVYSFLEAFKLKPGSHKISSKILYKLYKLWNKRAKISHEIFCKQFGDYIPTFKTTAARQNLLYFKLNERGAKLAYYVDQYFKFNKRNFLTNKNYRKHYEEFFRDIGLEPGPIFIEGDVLYHVYDTYMYRRKRKSHPYQRFEVICELFFECKYFDGTNDPWFGVSENIKQLISPQAVANWREGRKRISGKKRKPIKEEDKKEILYPEKE